MSRWRNIDAFWGSVGKGGIDTSQLTGASEQALNTAVKALLDTGKWIGRAASDVWHWVRDNGILKWVVAGVALWVNPFLALPAFFAAQKIEQGGSVREVAAGALKGLAISLAVAAIILPFTAPAAAAGAAGAAGASAATSQAAAQGAQTASAASRAVESGELSAEDAGRLGEQLASLAAHPAISEAGIEGLAQLGVDVDNPTPQQLAKARVIVENVVGDDLSGLSELAGPPAPTPSQVEPRQTGESGSDYEPKATRPNTGGAQQPRVYTL